MNNGEVNRVEVVNRYSFDTEGHCHRLNGKPLYGTSTVVQVLGKEGLTWWAAELAAVACLESCQHIPTIRAEYEAVCELSGKDKKNARDRLQRKYPIFKKARYAHKEKKESAATPGTNMHCQLEAYVKTCIYPGAGEPFMPEWECAPEVQRFARWSVENVVEFLWSEGHCYSETWWTGGICDCGAVLKDGAVAVIDFKSAKEAYFGPFVQCGGYAAQIEENGVLDRDGNMAHEPVFIEVLAVFPFGGSAEEPTITRNAEDYMEAFESAVIIYKLQQEFDKC